MKHKFKPGYRHVKYPVMRLVGKKVKSVGKQMSLHEFCKAFNDRDVEVYSTNSRKPARRYSVAVPEANRTYFISIPFTELYED